MARPREYDKEQVLNAATELFWKKGYHGTSLSELVSATQLNKQSMYQEFGSKSGLFKACLDNYKIIMGRKILSILSQEPVSTSNIHKLFSRQIDFISEDNFKGCMFVNSANELEHLDETAISEVELFFDKLEELFFACLCTSYTKAEAKIRAAYLVSLFSGLMTVGKVKKMKNEYKKLIKLALSVLK